VTNSPEHIKSYIDGTIERLGFTPDLYYLRVCTATFSFDQATDSEQKDTPIEQSIPALDEIRKAGKTKYIGLSECSAKTLRKANSST
jgi:aryl-alcohol dehydrogenase-like predicted oxidoreductase